ncbi:C2 domain protein [Metarhizium brunneum]
MESDDVSGVCELPLQDLTLDDNKMHWREYRLQGETARTDVKGVLEWEIGRFPRAPDRAKRDSAQTPWTQGTAIARRNKLLTRSRFKRNTVPDPYLLSGILGITIHQCINVEVNKPNKKSMSHVNFRGQHSNGNDAEEETSNIDYISSLYVAADIDDKLVYKTLVKSITNTRVFNSSTETYIGLGDGINTKGYTLRPSRSRRECKGWQKTESGYTWTLADKQALLQIYVTACIGVLWNLGGCT